MISELSSFYAWSNIDVRILNTEHFVQWSTRTTNMQVIARTFSMQV